jgi:hypothetical protein
MIARAQARKRWPRLSLRRNVMDGAINHKFAPIILLLGRTCSACESIARVQNTSERIPHALGSLRGARADVRGAPARAAAPQGRF